MYGLDFVGTDTTICEDEGSLLKNLESDRFKFDVSGIESTRSLNLSDSGDFLFKGEKTQITQRGFESFCKTLSIPNVFAKKIPTELLIENVNKLSESFEKPIKIIRRVSDNAIVNIVKETYSGIKSSDFVSKLETDFLTGSGDNDKMSSVVSTEGLRIFYNNNNSTQEVLEPQVGDIIRIGREFSNSDTGFGDACAKFVLYRLVCSNGVTMPFSFGVVRRNPTIKTESALNAFVEGFDNMALNSELINNALTRMEDELILDSDLVNFVSNVSRVFTNCSYGNFIGNNVEDKIVKEVAVDYLGIDQDRFSDIRKKVQKRKRDNKVLSIADALKPDAVSGLSYYDVFNKITAMPHNFRGDYNRTKKVEEIGGKIVQYFINSFIHES